jgi:hypothetical protein
LSGARIKVLFGGWRWCEFSRRGKTFKFASEFRGDSPSIFNFALLSSQLHPLPSTIKKFSSLKFSNKSQIVIFKKSIKPVSVLS